VGGGGDAAVGRRGRGCEGWVDGDAGGGGALEAADAVCGAWDGRVGARGP